MAIASRDLAESPIPLSIQRSPIHRVNDSHRHVNDTVNDRRRGVHDGPTVVADADELPVKATQGAGISHYLNAD